MSFCHAETSPDSAAALLFQYHLGNTHFNATFRHHRTNKPWGQAELELLWSSSPQCAPRGFYGSEVQKPGQWFPCSYSSIPIWQKLVWGFFPHNSQFDTFWCLICFTAVKPQLSCFLKYHQECTIGHGVMNSNSTGFGKQMEWVNSLFNLFKRVFLMSVLTRIWSYTMQVMKWKWNTELSGPF